MKIHHIGYLVKDISAAEEWFKREGFVCKKRGIDDSIRNVRISFLEKDGYIVELVMPLNGQSAVSGLMKHHSNSPYHICYETLDLSQTVSMLVESGARLVAEAMPAPAINNKLVAFLLDPIVGLLEILDVSEL